MFRPEVNDLVEIEGKTYTFPPRRPNGSLPYEAEGGRATVYRVRCVETGALLALKVFKDGYRNESYVAVAERLRGLGDLPGLRAAHQTVIRPDSPTVQAHPDLRWAALMPWIEGETWSKLLASVQDGKRAFARPEAERLSIRILDALDALEGRGIVHCDLSGGNVMIESRGGSDFEVQLVDLDDMFIDGEGPGRTVLGSKGYVLPGDYSTACPEGDRYAGAIFAAEALALALPGNDEERRRLISSEGVFRGNRTDPDADRRFAYACGKLQAWQPRFASLLEQAWHASSLQECAPLYRLLESMAEPVATMAIPTLDAASTGKVTLEDRLGRRPPSPPPPDSTGPEAEPPPTVDLPPVVNRGIGGSKPPLYPRPPLSPGSMPVKVAKPLYDGKSVLVATLLAGPLGAATLWAINERRLGRTQEAVKAFGVGLVTTVLLMAMGQFLPPGLGMGVSVGLAFAAKTLADQRQGLSIVDHLQKGGRKGSPWVAAAIALPLILVDVLLALALALMGVIR